MKFKGCNRDKCAADCDILFILSFLFGILATMQKARSGDGEN